MRSRINSLSPRHNQIVFTARMLVVALMLTLVATSCGGSEEAAEPVTAPGMRLEIRDFAFQPTTLAVKVGDTVTVQNFDAMEHTVTADDGSFDTGPLGQDQTGRFTVTKSGTFAYKCSIHPYMTGVIQVS